MGPRPWFYELGRINVQLEGQGFRKISAPRYSLWVALDSCIRWTRTCLPRQGYASVRLGDSEAVRVVMGWRNDSKILMKEKPASYFPGITSDRIDGNALY